MIRTLVLAGHLVAAGVLLSVFVYPFRESYDFWIVQNEARTIRLAGLVGRYLYATAIAWFCTGPLPWAVVERVKPDWPVASRVAWSVILGFGLMVLVAVLMGTYLLFPDPRVRPRLITWMDPFLAEFQFLAFIGYGFLLALLAIATQYLLRRT